MQKMKMFYPLFMAIVMMAISPQRLWAQTYAAEVTISGTTTQYETLRAAMTYAQGNSSTATATVKMLADFHEYADEDLYFAKIESNQNIIFDLNGKNGKFESEGASFFYVGGGNLTIIDSSESKSGKLQGTDDCIYHTWGKLLITGGTFDVLVGNFALELRSYLNEGDVTLQGGTFDGIQIARASDWEYTGVDGINYKLVDANGDTVEPTQYIEQTVTVERICDHTGDTSEGTQTAGSCKSPLSEQHVCSICGETYNIVIDYGTIGAHVDADNDGNCDVCGRVADVEEPVMVTAANYESLGLTADYIGYRAICNLKQFSYFANVYGGGLKKQASESSAKRRLAPARVVVPNETASADGSLKYVLTADIKIADNVVETFNGFDQNNDVLPEGTLLWESPILDAGDKEIVFDGNNHSISGLLQFSLVKVKEFLGMNDDYGVMGLFGIIGKNATVKNVAVNDSYFDSCSEDGLNYIAAIAGWANGDIENCKSDATIKSLNTCAGIAGYSSSNTIGCEFSGDITNSDYYSYAAGIVGELRTSESQENETFIKGCSFTGKVTVTQQYSYVGGIVGHVEMQSNVTISECSNRGTITVKAEYCHLGGIAAYIYYKQSRCKIINSYSAMTFDKNSTNEASIDAVIGSISTNGGAALTDKHLIDNVYYYANNASQIIGYQNKSEDAVISNCYILGDSYSVEENYTAVPASMFASGAIAYLMDQHNQEENRDAVWYQTIGDDAYPVLTGDEWTEVFADTDNGTYYNKEMESYLLQDATAYERMHRTRCAELTYQRTFYTGVWNAWYVPFAVSTSVLGANKLSAAYIEGIHNYDDDQDGSIDRTVMEVVKIKNGILRAGTPYLVKAEEGYTYPMVISDVTLENSKKMAGNDIATATMKYIVRGTYEGVSADVTNEAGNYYSLSSEGQMVHRTGKILPLRWYLQTESKGSMYDDTSAAGTALLAKSIYIHVVGEKDEATGISTLYAEGEQTMERLADGIFDMNGRRQTEAQKGMINIINGKKVFVK